MLELSGIAVSVGKKIILNDISFTFEKNKVYAIMGPNGSGKSTLAYALMGHPGYQIAEGSIFLRKRVITKDPPDIRSKKGIFLSFQSPLSLGGVRVHQLLQMALEKKVSALEVRKRIERITKELKMSKHLLRRSLNDGASGGEKKKMEVLQAAVLDKPIQIFDEVDTGVDIDSLKTIAHFLHTHKTGKTYIVITHYNRILHYLKPDRLLVLVGGRLVKTGRSELAEDIEKNGYEKLSSKFKVKSPKS